MGYDPTLTESAVRSLARPQSYDRGENYYDQGAVVDLVRHGETVRAAVEGSQYEPYQIRIDLVEHRPELAELVETRLETAGFEDAVDSTHDQTPDINRESIRQQVRHILRPSNGRSAKAHDPYAAAETDVENL